MTNAGERITASLLNQSYGHADTVISTLVGTTFVELSTLYTIPAGEASYPGAAYELRCGGNGKWGTTVAELDFAGEMNGAQFGSSKGGDVGSAAFAASTAFFWWAMLELVCTDGVSAWQSTLKGAVVASASAATPSTSVPISCSVGPVTANTAAAITVAIAAKWGGGAASTITNSMTMFRKIA